VQDIRARNSSSVNSSSDNGSRAGGLTSMSLTSLSIGGIRTMHDLRLDVGGVNGNQHHAHQQPAGQRGDRGRQRGGSGSSDMSSDMSGPSPHASPRLRAMSSPPASPHGSAALELVRRLRVRQLSPLESNCIH
jgi:hypothetical protein